MLVLPHFTKEKKNQTDVGAQVTRSHGWPVTELGFEWRYLEANLHSYPTGHTYFLLFHIPHLMTFALHRQAQLNMRSLRTGALSPSSPATRMPDKESALVDKIFVNEIELL